MFTGVFKLQNVIFVYKFCNDINLHIMEPLK